MLSKWNRTGPSGVRAVPRAAGTPKWIGENILSQVFNSGWKMPALFHLSSFSGTRVRKQGSGSCEISFFSSHTVSVIVCVSVQGSRARKISGAAVM